MDKIKYCVNQHLRASNSEINSPIWWEFILIRAFMPVQFIYKFHKVLIKIRTVRGSDYSPAIALSEEKDIMN